MGGFETLGAGMGITSYAQARMTDGLGNVRVKEFDAWTDRQEEMYNNRVDENTGNVTEVQKTAENTLAKPEIVNNGATAYPLGEGPKSPNLTIEDMS